MNLWESCGSDVGMRRREAPRSFDVNGTRASMSHLHYTLLHYTIATHHTKLHYTCITLASFKVITGALHVTSPYSFKDQFSFLFEVALRMKQLVGRTLVVLEHNTK